MKHCFFTLAATCALLVAPASFADDTNTTPTKNFDLARYLGLWHETARYDNLFERGLHAVTALYELQEDGRIRVTNSGTAADGERHDTVGMAQQQGASDEGNLEVSFVPPYTAFFSDYRVLYVTPDYSGALVSDADGSNLWLLERHSPSNPEVRERLLHEAQQRGFDTSELLYDSELESEAAVKSE